MTRLLTLHDPQEARQHYVSGIWQPDTMYTLARQHARDRPDAQALRDPFRRLTWRELLAHTDSVAESLHRAGLRQGDRVAAWLPSRAEVVVLFLACSRNGYVFCPSLHQNYTVAEVVELAQRMRCKALFVTPGYGADSDRYDIFASAADIPSLKRMYTVPPAGTGAPVPAGTTPFPGAADLPSVLSTPTLNPDKITYLAFTSGTTGAPKGVMHSDNTLLANGRALVKDWHHDKESIVLSLSPLSHHIGTVAIEQMLVAGMELVLHEPGAGWRPLDWLLETGATYVMGVPTHAMDLLVEMSRRGLPELGAVKSFYMAGSTIPQELAEKFLRIGVTPQNVYGMTENGSHQYTLPSDPTEAVVSTCGRACSGYEIRIWKQDDPDSEAGVGEIGEIGGRGGLLMLGYYGNQDATETSFNASGWFMSGDLGMLDEDGRIRIVGRKKDLIIRGGHNIHPARIEDLAHRHPDVLKAAAFPVADARLGERVCLAIIAQPGTELQANALLSHLYDAGLSKYDMPEYFIRLDSLPLTPSGKILKRELVQWVKEKKIEPVSVRWEGRDRTAATAH
ncbi:acyl--CoA ligase [Verticiella sediminum]|uniref:Acyl--CoA ligase n=3 Tax=Verticiella sediminum TaxID=1247510 RepID=A0A556AJP0_9BURK|nr:class I adenylate-forming enzyme family protein [Verticiella sediminum]TSH93128.1 acyl--CoA ligase [Verticiella sediminum]